MLSPVQGYQQTRIATTPQDGRVAVQPRVDTGVAAEAPEKKVSIATLMAAKDEANRNLEPVGLSVRMSIDRDTSIPVVKVVEAGTEKVVRQLPSDQMLEIAKSIDARMSGLIKETA